MTKQFKPFGVALKSAFLLNPVGFNKMSHDGSNQFFGMPSPNFPQNPSQAQGAFQPYPSAAANPGYPPQAIGFRFPLPQPNLPSAPYPTFPEQTDASRSFQAPMFHPGPSSHPAPSTPLPVKQNDSPAYIGKHGRPQQGLKWVKTSGRQIPEGAIQGGFESDNRPLYIGRGYHKGSLVVGKAAGHLNGCLIPFGGKEVLLSDYHVLVGDADKLKWRECFGKLDISGWVPLEAGNEANGEELFVAKTFHKKSEVIGKVSLSMPRGMSFGYGGSEVSPKEAMVYHVLSHA